MIVTLQIKEKGAAVQPIYVLAEWFPFLAAKCWQQQKQKCNKIFYWLKRNTKCWLALIQKCPVSTVHGPSDFQHLRTMVSNTLAGCMQNILSFIWQKHNCIVSCATCRICPCLVPNTNKIYLIDQMAFFLCGFISELLVTASFSFKRV